MKQTSINVRRRTADVGLASIFVHAGYRVANSPDGPADQLRAFAQRYAHVDPPWAGAVVRLNAAVMIGAGALLAVGRLRRVSAAVLALVLQPTNAVGHRFWEETGEDQIKEANAFLSNIAITGGLMHIVLGEQRVSPTRSRRHRPTR